MAVGLALLANDNLSAKALIERVAHPGGSSEAGSTFIREQLPDVFMQMLKKMKKW
ncbi:MAG: hypothetical protein JW841_02135 [Deltaproteobacteria bacterium]|nr:hypothetical protein [Deltaproteobacteria bacterium]